MLYFVISQDGQRYGPADIAMLNQWSADGRLMGFMTLEEEGTGRQLVASQLVGLSLPAQPHLGSYATGFAAPYKGPPPGPGGGQPVGYSFKPQQDIGSYDVVASFTISTIGLLLGVFRLSPLFGLISLLGIYFAQSAKTKGSIRAGSAFKYGVFCLAAPVVAVIAAGILLNIAR